MTWPWSRRRRRREFRAAYTDAIVNALQTAAGGTAGTSPLATGAVEIAASHYARAFAAATVQPARAAAALDPYTLSELVRDVIRTGEYVAEIAVSTDGRVRLLPADSWEVFGADPSPAEWRYRLTLGAPSGGSRVRSLPAGAVVHARYATDHRRPWAGLAPLTWAAETGRLVAAVERSLADEFASAPIGSLIPVPTPGAQSEETGEDTDPLAGYRADLGALRGALALVESTVSGWNAGEPDAPRADWRPVRLGPAPPAATVELRTAVERTVMRVLGIPPGLHADGAAAAAREGWRAWREGSVEPLGRLLAVELAEKLDAPDLAFDFSALQSAADLTARARAAHSLQQAGVEIGNARAAVGL